MSEPRAGRRIEIRGTVQGVGFRPWVFRLARQAGVAGRVWNDRRGVVIEAFGPPLALEAFSRMIEAAPPPAARILDIRSQPVDPEPVAEFTIVESQSEGQLRVSIPPDLATCAECRREIFDPADRRHRYPFTNCTNCGPRYTIARDVPYDRAATTMAAFAMCPNCDREYHDVHDRRFHAQPNACPVCGPQLSAVAPTGERWSGADALGRAVVALREGLIVAVKGIGGYHLACDAESSTAVARLRERKQRDEKPFAVMVRDLDEVRRLAVVSSADERLLESVERPVVLLTRRGNRLAVEVAPDSPLVGLFLPYSPLHHLLLAEVMRPLVMTSGNLAEEPMAFEDEDALARLGAIADLILAHDRAIENRCDDSVARVVAGKPVLLRRARGYVPRSIPVARPFERCVLAVGAHLKNVFAIAAGDSVTVGPHIGDLENVETLHALETAVRRLERFLGVRPEIVAHDLHPDYLSTRYALDRPDTRKIAVQHHHAHVASVMTEHGLEGPVIGVAYDGTGYGTDGTAWGGEILLADLGRYQRVATFRPLLLAGGETAIREVWRLALALVVDAMGDGFPLDSIPLFRRVQPHELAVVRRMLSRRFNSPLAHGVGRYFDALGSLGLERTTAGYEGQVALLWNVAAESSEDRGYPFEIDESVTPWELDLRPMVRATVHDLIARQSNAVISARFHNTLAQATGELIRRVAVHHGRLPVVLTGGCFVNPRLVEGVIAASAGFDVRLHSEVPPGDGGIALGQAAVADAMARQLG